MWGHSTWLPVAKHDVLPASIFIRVLYQSRSQSMPVRGLVVGMALAKPNQICNFIGCREINKTDIRIKR